MNKEVTNTILSIHLYIFSPGISKLMKCRLWLRSAKRDLVTTRVSKFANKQPPCPIQSQTLPGSGGPNVKRRCSSHSLVVSAAFDDM